MMKYIVELRKIFLQRDGSRGRHIVWGIGAFAWFAAISVTTLAQSPAVTALTGTLLVNGLACEAGMALKEDDVLETSAEGTATVDLSDGGRLEMGAASRVLVVKTLETDEGRHILRLKLTAGWVRAAAPEEAVDAGLAFDIETPNAVLGAKLATVDIEAQYHGEEQQTVGIARRTEIRAENRHSGEERYVPQGSTVLITADGMTIVDGTARSKSSHTLISGLKNSLPDTKGLLVIGGLVGATAATSLLVDTEEEVEAADFVGTFTRTATVEGTDMLAERLTLQAGRISDFAGLLHVSRSGSTCQFEYTRDLTGNFSSNTAFLTLAPVTYTPQCQSGAASVSLTTETWPCNLRSDNTILRCTKPDGTKDDYQKQ